MSERDRPRSSERDDDLRDVRLGGRVARVGGPAGEERSLGRSDSGSSRVASASASSRRGSTTGATACVASRCAAISRAISHFISIVPGEPARSSPIRSSYGVGEVGSKRVRHRGRTCEIARGIRSDGRIRAAGRAQLHEPRSRLATRHRAATLCPELVLLDLRRVNRVDRSGAEFSSALASFLHRAGWSARVLGRRSARSADRTGDRLLRPRRGTRMVRGRAAVPSPRRRRAESGPARRRMSCCTISVLTSLYA